MTLLLFVGCSAGDKQSGDSQAVQKLTSKVASLEASVEVLLQERTMREVTENSEKMARLTPGGTGYSVLNTAFGLVAVAIDDVRGYANGSKVVLRFGVLGSATILGASARVEWGAIDELTHTPDFLNAKSKEVKFADALLPARWNRVEVVLEEIPSGKLGWIHVSNVKNTGVRLYRQ
jgi:hypothetical protein